MPDRIIPALLILLAFVAGLGCGQQSNSKPAPGNGPPTSRPQPATINLDLPEPAQYTQPTLAMTDTGLALNGVDLALDETGIDAVVEILVVILPQI